MKIGILGGTFDPIHLGHLAIAKAAQKQFCLDKVLFIPAFIPPHKVARRDLTPAEYRYQMVKLAIADEPAFEICKIELDRPDISYTVDTLRALKKLYPDDELFLILGEDSLEAFSSWREPEEITRLAHILVAHRNGVQQKIDLNGKLEWIQVPVCPFASSEIRKRLSQKQGGAGMLPLAVEKYIREKKLYLERKHGNSVS